MNYEPFARVTIASGTEKTRATHPGGVGEAWRRWRRLSGPGHGQDWKTALRRHLDPDTIGDLWFDADYGENYTLKTAREKAQPLSRGTNALGEPIPVEYFEGYFGHSPVGLASDGAEQARRIERDSYDGWYRANRLADNQPIPDQRLSHTAPLEALEQTLARETPDEKVTRELWGRLAKLVRQCGGDPHGEKEVAWIKSVGRDEAIRRLQIYREKKVRRPRKN